MFICVWALNINVWCVKPEATSLLEWRPNKEELSTSPILISPGFITTSKDHGPKTHHSLGTRRPRKWALGKRPARMWELEDQGSGLWAKRPARMWEQEDQGSGLWAKRPARMWEQEDQGRGLWAKRPARMWEQEDQGSGLYALTLNGQKAYVL